MWQLGGIRAHSGASSPVHLVEVVKVKARVFSIIILAPVAFPCHFQGILVPDLRDPTARFRECCSRFSIPVLERHRNTSQGFGGHRRFPGSEGV